jgi:hypothetical protein
VRVDPVTVLRPVYRNIASHKIRKKNRSAGFQSDNNPMVTPGCAIDVTVKGYYA